MILSSGSLDTSRDVSCSVCIVGAGAAGITLACELDGINASVVVLEAGGVGVWDRVSQDPYIGIAEGVHPPPSHFRRLALGGTTTIWGGRCVPFEPIDFERREYVANSGWPISYNDVARYYPKAMQYCDAGSFDFLANTSFADDETIIPGFARLGDLTGAHIERYSLPTNFGRRYRERLERSQNVRLITHAHVTKALRGSVGERIEAVEFVTRSGRTIKVSAEVYVLAMGGIESARFLLASDANGLGLGNHSDSVGRYYTCHIENVLGQLSAKGKPLRFDFQKTRDGVYARRKIQLPETVQRANSIMNIAFRLHYPNIANPSHKSSVLSAMYLAKKTLIPEYRRILQHSSDDSVSTRGLLRHLENIARGTPELVRFSAKWTRLRLLPRRKLPYVLVESRDHTYPIEFHSEQTPLRESRVRLTSEKDAFGVPRVLVAWKTCDADYESIRKAYRLLKRGVESLDGCNVTIDEPSLTEHVASSNPVGGHHIGTTRMASTPSDGVVGKDCAVYGLNNLFVSSSAVFPTCSHANPTLTIVAMALRLADHLRKITTRQTPA